MTYGDYSFSPVPLINIAKNFEKSGGQTAVGTTFTLTLSGNIAILNGGGGLVNNVAATRDIREAFDVDGKYFKIECDGVIILECYPRIISLQFNESSNNWVQSIPYTIVVEYDSEPVGNIAGYGSGENTPGLMSPYISNYTDNWTVQFAEGNAKYAYTTSQGGDSNPIVLQVSHNLSAQGKSHYSGPGDTGTPGTLNKPAWQEARDYVNSLAGWNSEMVAGVGGLNLNANNFTGYDHFRIQSVDKAGGVYTLTENWTALSTNISNPRAATEDFTIDIVNALDAEYGTVTVGGTIQGLQTVNYGTNSGDFAIVQDKYVAASGYWNSIKGSLLYGRADFAGSQEGLTLNAIPSNRTVGHSPSQGIITYNYEYNTRPSYCIPNARYENVIINDSKPAHAFNTIQVLGRAQGPIFQYFNTVTEFTRTVQIDLLMSGNQGCGFANLVSGNNPERAVETGILCPLFQGLNSMYSTIYTRQDSSSWSPKTGRYSRNVVWAAGDCNISPNPTGYC